jgi:hypothetical protein
MSEPEKPESTAGAERPESPGIVKKSPGIIPKGKKPPAATPVPASGAAVQPQNPVSDDPPRSKAGSALEIFGWSVD